MHISLYLPHPLSLPLNLLFTLSFLFIDEPAKSDRHCSPHLLKKKQFTQRSKQLKEFPVGGASGRGLFKAAWLI